MLTNGHYPRDPRARYPRGVERTQRIDRTQRILPYEPRDRSLTRRFFDEGDQHEADQEWEEDVANTNAAEDPERRFSSFDRVPKRHGPRRIAAAAFLLVGAGFLWHYRQGARELVLTRIFHEPLGSEVTADQAASPRSRMARFLDFRAKSPAAPAAPAGEQPSRSPAAPQEGIHPTASAAERNTAAFDQGPHPLPPPEATAPVPATPAAATEPDPSPHQALGSATDAPRRLAGEPSGDAVSSKPTAREDRPSRQRAQQASSPSSGTRAKRGYVWSPSAKGLVPAADALPTDLPPSAGPPPSRPAAAPTTSQARLSTDDTLAPSVNATPPTPAAVAPKEAPPAASEQRPEEPAPKTIASPSLASPPVIAPPRAAPEPDERPVTPTEPPPFK